MGVVNQLARPFLALNIMLLLFLLWSFTYIEPKSGNWVAGIIAGVFLFLNTTAALVIIYADWDI